MQRALLAGLIIGILCPVMGVFLVLKRLSMVGETLAHVSLSGVLVGFLFNLNPVLAALLTALLSALGIEKLGTLFKTYGEIALAIFTSAGLGLAVILFNIVKTTDTTVQSLLFGSIIAITDQDLAVIWSVGVIIVGLIVKLYAQLFFLTFDEEGAQLAGINCRFLNLMLLFMTSCVVAVGMRIVGALLVSSLLVLPVAGSMIICKSFRATIVTAVGFSLTAIFAGIMLSFYFDLAPGGAIIMLLLGLFGTACLAKKIAELWAHKNDIMSREVQQ